MGAKAVKLLVLLITAVSMFFTGDVANADDNNIRVALDGQVLELTHNPVVWQNRTYVPFRDIFEKLGASVEWNGEKMTVIATKDDVTVEVNLYSKLMLRNNVPIDMGDCPMIYENRFMVPVRFIANAMNNPVSWDEGSKTVHIAKSNREQLRNLLDLATAVSIHSYHEHTTYTATASTSKDMIVGKIEQDGTYVVRTSEQIDQHLNVKYSGELYQDKKSFEMFIKDGISYQSLEETNHWETTSLSDGTATTQGPMELLKDLRKLSKFATLDESDSHFDIITFYLRPNDLDPSLTELKSNKNIEIRLEIDKGTHDVHHMITEVRETLKGVDYREKFDTMVTEINNINSIDLPEDVQKAIKH